MFWKLWMLILRPMIERLKKTQKPVSFAKMEKMYLENIF
jgi:hypothetical protein